MRIYLVRHGQTAWNVEGRAQGHTDVSLDETGRSQSLQFARYSNELKISKVWASDLQRATVLAQMIAEVHAVPIWNTPLLRERSFGDWEGTNFEEIRQAFADRARELQCELHEVRAPNGESSQDVLERLEEVLAKLQTERENVLIVSHGGTCSLLLAMILGASPAIAKSFRFHNTGLTTLERRADGHYNLIGYNDTAHLQTIGVEMKDASSPISR